MLGTGWAVFVGLASGFGCDSSFEKITCPDGEAFSGGKCVPTYNVRADSVGYLPNRIKRAVFVGDDAAFSVHSADDDSSVFDGTAAGPTLATDTGEMVYIADFSKLTQPGKYYVKAKVGRSATFTIGSDAFVGALSTTMLGLYGQRCSVDVDFEHADDEFKHGACHTAAADLSRVSSGSKTDHGGWHDAGDYGKYSVNGAFSVAFLMSAYEHFSAFAKTASFDIPEKGGDVPDLLDEARVELEWLLEIQFEDGSFSHKVTAKNFEGFVMPEADTQKRYFVSASSAGTGDSVAALAQAARLYGDFDADFAAKCLAAAKKGQDWLDAHPKDVAPQQSDITTGGYTGGADRDERLWALAELWETTGDAKYLAPLEQALMQTSPGDEFDWANVGNLGMGTYVRSTRAGRDPAVVSKIAKSFVASAENQSAHAAADAYGRGIGSYYWGINGVVARTSYNLMVAYYVSPQASYLDTLEQQIDHLFGENYYNRSFVTGIGTSPPLNPHHRPSSADKVTAPWPGLMIGGPHTRRFSDPDGTMAQYPATVWTDATDNYLHNEVAINWNTALVYALVALSAADDDAKPCDKCITDGSGGAGGTGNMGGAGGSSGLN